MRLRVKLSAGGTRRQRRRQLLQVLEIQNQKRRRSGSNKQRIERGGGIGKQRERTWPLAEELRRALARLPKGLEDDDEPGTAQAAPPVTSSRIAIVEGILASLLLLLQDHMLSQSLCTTKLPPFNCLYFWVFF